MFARIFKLFMMVIITPLFITGVFLFYYQNHSKTEILENYKNLTALASDFVRQSIEDSSLKLEYLARLNTDKQKNFLEEVKNTIYLNPQFTFIALLDDKGKTIFSVNSQEDNFSVDLSSFPYLKNITDKQMGLGPLESLEGGTIPILYPRTDGQYLFALLDIAPLMEKLENKDFGKSGGFYFINQEGDIISFSSRLLPDIAPEEIKQFLHNSFLIKKAPARDNTLFVGAWQKTIIPQTYLALLQYKQEAFWNINLITWLIAFFILATTTLSYFAALIFSQEVSKPVEDLTKAAKQISKNNFDITLDTADTWGEFEILTNTFKDMALRLKNYQAMQLDKILDEKKKLDLLVSLMRDGIIMCTLKGRKLFANDTADFILQSGVLAKDKALRDKNQLEIILKQKQNKIFSVYKDNKEYYFEVIKDTFKPSKAQALAVILFRDITYEHQINQMKESIFNSIAHDLRAPLLGLQGYLMLLTNTTLTKEQKQMLDNMEKSTQTLTSLIENILDISKIEKGLLKLNKTSFFVKNCAQQVINELQAVARNKNIEIQNLIDKKVLINADEQLIKRVFSNLISNALKFTEKGKIIVSYDKGKVCVKDSGPGIAPNQLAKIFDKYNKGNSKEKGYGLGLNISRHIIEAHGGTIEAKNNKEGGACFLFSVEEVL